MDPKQLVKKALAIRDESLIAARPPTPLPEPLPQNVQDIPSQILTPEEIAITECDPVSLVRKVTDKELACETVIKAFLARASLAQKAVNCITELLYSRAVARARHLDSLPEPAGPLHGLPISVKEQFGFEGKINSNSFVAWCDRQQEPPCSLNRILEEKCGAVIFARTTQPQTVMHLETNSKVYGRTVNPWNRNLTAGGSSGGEGALVGFKGSPLGLGGDIGGSIRVPAANNGIYGLKPSPYRVGNTGGMGVIVGQEGIIGCNGPLSTTLSGIELFMKSYLDTSPWVQESNLLPIPWRKLELPKRLKIGVMWSDGVVKPHPPILRGLSMVVDALSAAADFEIMSWQPYGHDECWQLTSALYYEDGGYRIGELIQAGGKEPLPLTTWLLEETHIKQRTVEEVWDLKARRNSYRAMYNQLWLDTGKDDGHPIDAILCPVGPGCAPRHDQAKDWCYTSQWNLLEYPAISFPVSHVDQNLDLADESYIPSNPDDAFDHRLYTGPEMYRDAPISLQLVTRRYEDEKCLEVLRRVEIAMEGNH
ncbi:putative amidase [Colletotrichum aenigma]|uniref:putative amidase n=1 Tax=Colletotrichum aenigma TaxID=1215731 RepID=UPI0018725CF7|nr:putative amidase [Colletotrichum aenigma]KAF5517585.1 putative amidase [Colletotrichum aenigma]